MLIKEGNYAINLACFIAYRNAMNRNNSKCWELLLLKVFISYIKV